MKNLLIFFGEYRTFDYIIPQLKSLNEVDILVSTWNQNRVWSNNNMTIFEINENSIKKNFPNAKIVISEYSDDYTLKNNIWKMFFHWKEAINSITNSNEYDKVIVSRCDAISEWHLLLDREFLNDTLYIQSSNHLEDSDKLWVGDYIFAGNFNIIKKFINFFDKDDYDEPHFPIGDVILKNKLNWSPIEIQSYLIRPEHIDFIQNLTNNNQFLIDMEPKILHDFYEIYNR